MNRTKKICTVFLIIQLIALSACSREPSPYDYDYPKDVTPRFCFENYKAFDPNIRYTECYEFVSTRKRTEKVLGMASIEYSAIKDVDDLSFIVCYKTIHWFGENRWIYVLRRNDCDIEPIMDYTPSQIELCTYDDLMGSDASMIDVEEDPESYYRYAENTFSDPILTIDSPEAIAEIMAVAQCPTMMTTERSSREDEVYPSRYSLKKVLWQEKPVYVKITFAECAGLVWVGELLTDDEGRAYMERSAYVHGSEEGQKEANLLVSNDFAGQFMKSWGYPLGEHMDAILSGLTTGE